MTQRIIVPSAGVKAIPAHGGSDIGKAKQGDMLSTDPNWVYATMTSGPAMGVRGWLPAASIGTLPSPVVLGWWHDVPWPGGHAAYYASTVGQKPGGIHIYTGLARPDTGLLGKLREIVAAGALPLVTLELWDYTVTGPNQPAYACSTFQGATHDAQLIPILDTIGALDGPVIIRPWHEFNYKDYPWALGVNGNDSWSFIAGWIRLAGLIRQHAPKALICWCPGVSIPFGLATEFEQAYPGDQYVDVLGLDGYNKSTAGNPQGAWWSFDQVVRPTYNRLVAMNPRLPIILAEFGCHAVGGDRAAWIGQIAATVKTMPNLRALYVWDNDEHFGAHPLQCTLETDAPSLAAFRTLAADPIMQGTW